MAIKFNQTKGEAKKDKLDSYTYTGKEDHHVRLVGDLLPRYVYWVKGENGKNIPMECLAFDRNTETFNRKEKDHVQDYFTDLKCGWSYAIQCIDYGDNKVKIFNLKKKLFEQLTVAMEDLGDPTDPETGWDVFFKRKKINFLFIVIVLIGIIDLLCIFYQIRRQGNIGNFTRKLLHFFEGESGFSTACRSGVDTKGF